MNNEQERRGDARRGDARRSDARRSDARRHVVVVGAGIVGVSTAIELLRAGLEVTLIDRGEPGEGTSFGNGGVLAACAVVPVTVPGLLKKAPKMLFSADQPLFLKWSYLPRLLPWLRQYLKHANAADARRIAAAMNPIIGDSLADHQALARGTRAERWLRPSDYVFLYRDRAAFEADHFAWDIRRAEGFRWREIEGDAVAEYDPHISPDIRFLVALPDHGHITDPGQYVKDLAAHAVEQGARWLQGTVSDVVRENSQTVGVRVDGETVAADDVVLATGAWSRSLTDTLGISIPLESERGYHLELVEPSFMPSVPCMVASGKFVMTPMDGRLRLAGVVEFGGLNAPPSREPIELLKRQALEALPGITWRETREWLGHRPAPTDSIPLIGALDHVPGTWLGFGHQHVGLTGGPKTGRLLAQLISGNTPNIDMSPYAPARFATR
ncbi:MAG: FAD-dependent oxidoreductase [Pseudomonadota bacterium]